MNKKLLTKVISILLAILLSAFAFVGCSSNSDDSSTTNTNSDEKVTIRLADMPIYAVAFFGYAEKTGILKKNFADYNVDFEINTFESGPAENESFAADKLDFAIMGNMPAVTGVSSDYGDKIISLAYTSEYPGAIVVPKNSKIKSVSDLKGKKVGTVIGGGYHYYTGVYLAEAGLSINDIDLINTGAETATSIKSGEIDAGVVDPSVARQLVNDGDGKIIKEKYDEQPMGVVCGSSSFVEKYPELTKVLLESVQETYDSISEDRDSFFKYIADVTGSDTTSLEETWDLRDYKISDFSDKDLSSMDDLFNWMKDNELVSNDEITSSELYNLDVIKNL
jgi:sulfonate transport system substrate-binding protein